MPNTIRDTVSHFYARGPCVTVGFNGAPSDYTIDRTNPNIGRITGAIAQSWATQQPVVLEVSDVVIIGVGGTATP